MPHKIVLQRLQDAGHAAYMVGGCVRDRLLGLPVKDVDIATSAIPREVLQVFPHGTPVTSHSGAPVVIVDGIEVATFRTEQGSRHTIEVQFASTVEEDAARRDLTINALYEDTDGNVLDPTGQGLADLRQGVIRFVGCPYERIAEDKTRAFRAIRFLARFGFSMCPKAWEAIYAVALDIPKYAAWFSVPYSCGNRDDLRWPRWEKYTRDDHHFSRLATEQVSRELEKILLLPPKKASEGIRWMHNIGLLRKFLPEVSVLQGVEQNAFHQEGCVLTHTLLVLENCSEEAPLEVRLACLLHDIGKPATQAPRTDEGFSFHKHEEVGAEMVREALRRLCFPNKTVEAVEWLTANHMAHHRILEMRRGRVANLFRHEQGRNLLHLGKADQLGKIPQSFDWERIAEMYEEFTQEDVTLRDLGINGHVIMERTGLKPGPELGAILRKLEEMLAENPEITRDELLKEV